MRRPVMDELMGQTVQTPHKPHTLHHAIVDERRPPPQPNIGREGPC
jgi:hypothetical protein